MVAQQIGNDTFSGAILGLLNELEQFAQFVKENPSLVGLPQLELENLFLEQRTNELSGGTSPAIIVGGIGEENIRERNRILHERLQLLKIERIRDGHTVGETLAGRTEFGGGFLFPAITDAFENDPSSNAALLSFFKHLVTSPIGIPKDPRARSTGFGLDDVPGPLRPIIDAMQTSLSPIGVTTIAAAPVISASGAAAQSGLRAGLASVLEGTAGRALLAEIAGNLGSAVAEELDAPLLVQIFAGLGTGIGATKAANIVDRSAQVGFTQAIEDVLGAEALRELQKQAIEIAQASTVTSGPMILAIETLEAFTDDELRTLISVSLPPIISVPDFNEPGSFTPEQQQFFDAFFARNPGVENLSPLEQESLFLMQEFERRGVQPIGNPPFGTQEFVDSRRRQLEDAVLAEQRRRDQAIKEQLEAERLRQRQTEINAERIAPVLAEIEAAIRALQADAADRTAAERTTEFSSTSDFAPAPVDSGSRFGFGTGAHERLQAAREEARGVPDQAMRPAPITAEFRKEDANTLEDFRPETLLFTEEHWDWRLAQAEALARARRESAATAAEEQDRVSDSVRKALRQANGPRRAVDLMDAMREADLRAEALRQSEAIATEEERMLKEARRKILSLADAARKENASQTANAGKGPGRTYRSRTGGEEQAAAARWQRELEEMWARLPVSARRVGETDLAGGGF